MWCVIRTAVILAALWWMAITAMSESARLEAARTGDDRPAAATPVAQPMGFVSDQE